MIFNYLVEIFVFVFGVCIGSFLNCAVYRMESKKSLSGRSFCPHCKHILSWKDLFPVFSFVFLGGKCRYCKAKISAQYPLVELATGVIFLLIFNMLSVIPNLIGNPGGLQTLWIPAFAGMTINLAFLFYVASALIVIFIYDLKHYIIPDKVLFPAIIITFIYQLFSALGGPALGWQIVNYLLAALIASGFFLAIFLLSKGRAMGFGDVKLAILMGLLLGVPNIFVALFLAFFFGAIIGIILMIYKGKSLKSEIPFGPFLISGTFLAMLYGNQIIQWYSNLFQI